MKDKNDTIIGITLILVGAVMVVGGIVLIFEFGLISIGIVMGGLVLIALGKIYNEVTYSSECNTRILMKLKELESKIKEGSK